MKVLPILYLTILFQGRVARGRNVNGLSIGGLFFKLFPESENRYVQAQMNGKVRLYLYDRAPSSDKERRSPTPYRGDYRLINTRKMEEIVDRLNTSLPTMVFIHGFMETDEPNVITKLTADMNRNHSRNVIIVDWHTLSAGPWYPWAVTNVPAVGRYLAKFLDSLARAIDEYGDHYSNSIFRHKRSSYSFLQNLHLVGFSLGAHVAGIAGHQLTTGRLGRITGIEPAYPMVELLREKSERLDSSDADFVDVIHTCSGVYGSPGPVGHADFYPNGGKAIQPGCRNTLARYVCSHWRAWSFFAESALNEKSFESLPCESWEEFENGFCDHHKNDVRNDPVYMGLGARSTARGKYYLRTNPSSPFSVPL